MPRFLLEKEQWSDKSMTTLMQNFASFANALPGTATEGLIWGIMAIGLYITYKLLDIADLTVDGSFCTGGAVCAAMLAVGQPLWLAMCVAFLAGMIAGLITGLLHTKCEIPAILASILTQLGLWSINMAIMGMKSNLAVMASKHPVLVAMIYLEDVKYGYKPFYYHPILVLGVLTVLIIGLLYWFFGTERGASIRATGANEHMARAQGINTQFNKVLGLVLANGFVALSGALLAQYNGAADINMGRGAIVIGLAAIVMGEVIFGRLFKNFALKLAAVSFGAIIYFAVLQMVITLIDVDAQFMKLFSAAVVAVMLAIPNVKKQVHRSAKPAGKE